MGLVSPIQMSWKPMRPGRPRVVLSSRAEDDRDDIYVRGIDAWGDRQAEAYLKKILAALDSLADFPEIVPVHPELREGVRALPVERHVIYYVIATDEIQVGRIFHARQDPTAAAGI